MNHLLQIVITTLIVVWALYRCISSAIKHLKRREKGCQGGCCGCQFADGCTKRSDDNR